MDIGMLWFDDSARPLGEKLQRAVEHYARKYGRQPTLCLVHPGGLDSGEGVLAGVHVRGARSVMPNHLWVGVDEQPARPVAARRTASTATRAVREASARAPRSRAA
jgi:hypothetical protein